MNALTYSNLCTQNSLRNIFCREWWRGGVNSEWCSTQFVPQWNIKIRPGKRNKQFASNLVSKSVEHAPLPKKIISANAAAICIVKMVYYWLVSCIHFLILFEANLSKAFEGKHGEKYRVINMLHVSPTHDLMMEHDLSFNFCLPAWKKCNP